MEEFEDNLNIAFTRIKRTELKSILISHEENTFHSDITEAFKKQERDRLKTKLIELSDQQDNDQRQQKFNLISANKYQEYAQPVEKKTKSFFIYWKYSAIVLLLLSFGLIFYKLSLRSNENKMAIQKKNKIEIPILDQKEKSKEINKEQNQIFESVIFVEDIGQLGFVRSKIDVKVFVNKTSKGIKYKFYQNKLAIKSSKKLSLRILKIQEVLYFKIEDRLFQLIENKDFENPKEVSDSEILDIIP